ncbi:hypothetical protein ABIB62_003845 [Mucilaginibacter sp. UYP25]
MANISVMAANIYEAEGIKNPHLAAGAKNSQQLFNLSVNS